MGMGTTNCKLEIDMKVYLLSALVCEFLPGPTIVGRVTLADVGECFMPLKELPSSCLQLLGLW